MSRRIKVFRLSYIPQSGPGPMLRCYSAKTGGDYFPEKHSGPSPEGFQWGYEIEEEGKKIFVFTKDDFLLEEALNNIVSQGYDIISVLGPMDMRRNPRETSYQIVAREQM